MRKIRINKILFYLVLGIATFIYLGPFLFSISISLNADKNVFQWPVKLLPDIFTLDNYYNVWNELPFGKWLFNSLLVTTVQTISNVFFSALAGFAFARLRFRGRTVIFNILLSSLMVPGIILLVPKFIVLNQFELINSYAGLIVPGLVGVTNIFLMKQFFETIPKDIEQAALLDGCSYFRIFWQVFLPISKPALAAVAIYTFQGSWNEFLWPVIVTYTDDMYTLPLGMASLKTELLTDWPLLMAGTIMISLPTLLIFIIFQRYFVQGVASSGLKG